MADLATNGEAAPKLTIQSPIVNFLKQLLADAEANRIDSIGVAIITNTQQIGTVHMGARRGDLYVAAALLQKRILADIDPPVGSGPTRPTIIRATMGG